MPTVGYIILAVSLAVLGLSPLDLLFASLLGFMIGIGTATGQTLLYAFAPARLQRPVRNRGVGSTVAAGRVGTIVGPFVAGQLLMVGLTSGQVLVVLAPVAIAALVLCLLVVRFTAGRHRRRRRRLRPPSRRSTPTRERLVAAASLKMAAPLGGAAASDGGQLLATANRCAAISISSALASRLTREFFSRRKPGLDLLFGSVVSCRNEGITRPAVGSAGFDERGTTPP